MSFLSDPNAWLGLLTLTALEIVLGIDNIIFLSILAGKVAPEKQQLARRLGLAGAFITRVLLLLSISWIARLTTPLFSLPGLGVLEMEAREITGRDVILVLGGLFLIAKATYEIHHKLEDSKAEETGPDGKRRAGYSALGAVIVQIALVDIVFSLDSVITAVGMVNDIGVMITANVIALAFMLLAAGPIARFVDRHPSVKMLALSFLVLIGTNLVAEGLGQHVPKGYTYFAMFFSIAVEMLNLRLRKAATPVKLRDGVSIERGLVGED